MRKNSLEYLRTIRNKLLQMRGYMLIALLANIFSSNAQSTDTIHFCGFKWMQKVSETSTGPGNNIFGIHPKNVSIDKNGYLNLKIHRSLSCAEIYSIPFFKEGTIEVTILTNNKRYTPEMVLGLFLYDENAIPHHNEIDIEFAQWGNKSNKNMQYAIHTNSDIHLHRFSFTKGKQLTKHIIQITDHMIHIKSLWYNKKSKLFENITEHSFLKPEEFNFKQTRFRFNLWLSNNTVKPLWSFPKIKITSFKYIAPVQ